MKVSRVKVVEVLFPAKSSSLLAETHFATVLSAVKNGEFPDGWMNEEESVYTIFTVCHKVCFTN